MANADASIAEAAYTPATVEPVTQGLLSTAASYDSTVLQAVNAVQKPATAVSLPKLTEFTLPNGAQAALGGPSTFLAVQVDGLSVEKGTGYDFLLMRQAALAAKVPGAESLWIVSGWRDSLLQARLRRERVNPDGTLTPLGQKLGTAAPPGGSYHETGRALDLNVGMDVTDLKANRLTPIFTWIQAHCAEYGFSWKDGKNAKEPWHYTHTLVEYGVIKGTPIPDGPPISADVGAARRAAREKEGLAKRNAKQAHDANQKVTRAAQAANTTRDQHYGEHAAQAHGAAVTSRQTAASYVQMANMNDIKLAAFSPEDQSATTYDFDLGLWGGKEPT